MKDKFTVLGIMSGTSLDGLDLAICTFDTNNFSKFEILEAKTEKYPIELENQLRNSQNLNAKDFVFVHKQLGKFIAQSALYFVHKYNIDFIASHGHTSIHLPQIGVNFQLGDGAVITAITQKPVVCDFRSVDIALGGQGAPLVPIGDYFLFPQYDALLNIGGFSNITIKKSSKIIAFDISPANFVFNFFARQFAKQYDEFGNIGKSGNIDFNLLSELDNLDFFTDNPPKSLSDHWFYEVYLPILNKYNISTLDKLRTCYENISNQIAIVIEKYQVAKLLVTGGGAYNTFLIELLRNKTIAQIVVPEPLIVEYKEALIFAFLGLLRYLDKENCLSSVTGAVRDNIGGAIYYTK